MAASPAEATFAAAVAAFTAGRDAQRRRELVFEDVPAPRRLAPYATAIAASVQRDDNDVASGRLVLLYDPDGQQGWDGVFRLVAYVRADVEPEMAADPLLGEVGWSWLSEALDARVPGYAVPSGTVTRVITEGFGAKRDEVPLTGFELRASWSPVGPPTPGGRLPAGPAILTSSTCRRTSRRGATACPPRPGWNRRGRGPCVNQYSARRGTGERWHRAAARRPRRRARSASTERPEAGGIIPLLEPRDGLPPVVAAEAALAEVTGRLADGKGPVAVDAERASGYRYGQRAYLVQLRRAGAGTVLIDPIACPDLSGVDAVLHDAEAVLHAASQDLPCLAEVGFRPQQLFDTELAGRRSATRGWPSARWWRKYSDSTWRRATRRPTGRSARCARSCSATRPWMWKS